jgi:electron transport complex protein RnfC
MATVIPDISETYTFKHGIHPEEYKELSDQCSIERMPFIEEYMLPLSQHAGAPSKSIVRKGQQVRRGEKIAEAVGFVSTALHSPVDGTVIAIDNFEHPNGKMQPGIKIKTDVYSTQQMQEIVPFDLSKLDSKSFASAVQGAGIVGMGGAAFPAHVKFSIPADKQCDIIMVNGCECEPFLTADHRMMLEYAEELIDGIEILKQYIGAKKANIAIEINKLDAIATLQKVAADSDFPIEVTPLAVKYPQGAEKMMISAIMEEEIPSGKLPIDLGIVVSNVGTITMLSDYFRKGIPLMERVLTVTGTAIKRPTNILVPIGTPIREVINYCGGMTSEASRVLLGGPMMGSVQKNLDTPVLKGTSGILVLSPNEVKDLTEYNCVRCSRCIDACPMMLNPSMLGLLAKKGLWEEMAEDYHVMDCFECASCSYVCPSAIPLVQSFRIAKGIIREQSAKKIVS